MKTVEDIFNECQHKEDYKKEIQLMTKLLNKNDFEQFFETFIKCYKQCLAVQENAPVVTCTLNFVAEFAAVINANQEIDSNKENAKPSGDNSAQFMDELWAFTFKNFDVANSFVRLHICHFIGKILDVMSDDANLDDDLFKLLRKSMLRSLADKNSSVRAKAAWALARLQDTSDSDCPVIKTFVYHMISDPCYEVRQAIVKVIGINSTTLPSLISRIRDVKEGVRKSAYEALAQKIPMKLLSIAQRIDVLKQGLHDRSEKVRRACVDSLLMAWQKQCKKNLLTCLKSLDVIDATETSKEAFEELIAIISLEDAIAKFDLLDENRIIKSELLNPEAVFYWRLMCEHVSNQQDGVQELEKILPYFPQFYEFLINLFEESIEDDDTVQHMEKMFICQQLLTMALLYDFVDEDERRRGVVLSKLLLLSHIVDENITGSVIKLLEKVMPSESDRINFIVEMITEIREKKEVTEVTINAEERRQLTLKCAQLKIEIHISKDELETCVSKQEFDKCQEKKDNIAKLEAELAELTIALQPQMKEVCEEKDDPITLQKCLLIYCFILEEKSSVLPKPTYLSLIESLILPSIGKVDKCVRQLGVKALGLSCISDVDLASRHLLLLLEICQLDAGEVRLTAIKALFDILLWHGFNIFSSVEEKSANDSCTKNESDLLETTLMDKMMNKLLNMFLLLLDSEFPDVHVVVCEGFCKLLMAHRLASSKIVGRLLIMWFNPITEDNHILRNILGVFFEVFSTVNANQKLFEEAFLPTLNIIFDAPRTSPIYQISAMDVAKFLVELLRPLKNMKKTDKWFHDSLAVKICNEILSDPYSVKLAVLAKVLKDLILSGNPEVMAELTELCSELNDVIDDKNTSFIRFYQQVKEFNSSSNDSQGHVSESSDENEEFEENNDGDVLDNDADNSL